MKNYSIDGIYGRVEITQLDQQPELTTHNFEEIEDMYHTLLSEPKEFIPGLPRSLSTQEYFQIALIQRLDKIAEQLSKFNKSAEVVSKFDLDKVSEQVISKINLDMQKYKFDKCNK